MSDIMSHSVLRDRIQALLADDRQRLAEVQRTIWEFQDREAAGAPATDADVYAELGRECELQRTVRELEAVLKAEGES
jgi:hypothetical protein